MGHGPDGTPETLAERKNRFSDLRYTEDGAKTISTSIEHKRHELLKRSIETLAGEPGGER